MAEFAHGLTFETKIRLTKNRIYILVKRRPHDHRSPRHFFAHDHGGIPANGVGFTSVCNLPERCKIQGRSAVAGAKRYTRQRPVGLRALPPYQGR
ncbi:protein of unknown function [Pararobbsia alpina]